jgi:hypothetical protein
MNKLPLSQLELRRERLIKQIERDEALLKDLRQHLEEVQAGIASARLQAWYAANPGIELRVGDVLLDDRNNSYTIEEHYLHSYDTEPEVMAICNEDGEPEEFDIDTARRMREAWLAQEAGA